MFKICSNLNPLTEYLNNIAQYNRNWTYVGLRNDSRAINSKSRTSNPHTIKVLVPSAFNCIRVDIGTTGRINSEFGDRANLSGAITGSELVELELDWI